MRRKLRKPPDRPAVLFLYANDWSHELPGVAAGTVPSHRLFGFADLPAFGLEPKLWATRQRFPRLVSHVVAWRVAQAMWAARHQSDAAAIVCTTETAAIPVLALCRIGVVRRPVIVISVALLNPSHGRRLRLALWRALLPKAAFVTVYASDQLEEMRRRFRLRASQVRFIPFGVDTTFFCTDRPPQGRLRVDVLSVGTNFGKDYPTLLEALPDGASAMIVTDDPNRSIIERSGREVPVLTHIPIVELRDLYASASVVAIPLRSASYSAGQTVLLETMAMGRGIVISGVPAVSDYVRPGVDCLSVPPADPPAMRDAILRLLGDEDLRHDLGEAAAQRVIDRFSARGFAGALAELCREAAADGSS